MKTIKEHMLIAKSRGINTPRMTIGAYTFKLAPDHGRNPGAIYVTTGPDKTYLGMVIDNQFNRQLPDHKAEVQAILDNPQQAAEVHGQRTGLCCICSRTLFNRNSIAAMIGPICAEKWGFDIPVLAEFANEEF